MAARRRAVGRDAPSGSRDGHRRLHHALRSLDASRDARAGGARARRARRGGTRGGRSQRVVPRARRETGRGRERHPRPAFPALDVRRAHAGWHDPARRVRALDLRHGRRADARSRCRPEARRPGRLSRIDGGTRSPRMRRRRLDAAHGNRRGFAHGARRARRVRAGARAPRGRARVPPPSHVPGRDVPRGGGSSRRARLAATAAAAAAAAVALERGTIPRRLEWLPGHVYERRDDTSLLVLFGALAACGLFAAAPRPPRRARRGGAGGVGAHLVPRAPLGPRVPARRARAPRCLSGVRGRPLVRVRLEGRARRRRGGGASDKASRRGARGDDQNRGAVGRRVSRNRSRGGAHLERHAPACFNNPASQDTPRSGCGDVRAAAVRNVLRGARARIFAKRSEGGRGMNASCARRAFAARRWRGRAAPRCVCRWRSVVFGSARRSTTCSRARRSRYAGGGASVVASPSPCSSPSPRLCGFRTGRARRPRARLCSSPFAGIVAVGMADTRASVAGVRLGKRRRFGARAPSTGAAAGAAANAAASWAGVGA